MQRGFIREVCAILRDDSGLQFNFFSDVTCVDWYPSEPRFEVIYHLFSIPKKLRLRLKVKLSGHDPCLESVTSVWPAANFYEREVFDLFGVRFTGHPHLERLLMPDNWEGHPLRKDFPLTGHVEVRYDDEAKRVVYEPVKLVQEFRSFDYLSPWEGTTYILPGDEKAKG